MAQWLRMGFTLGENLSSVPSFHIPGGSKLAVAPTLGNSVPTFGLYRYLYSCAHIHIIKTYFKKIPGPDGAGAHL